MDDIHTIAEECKAFLGAIRGAGSLLLRGFGEHPRDDLIRLETPVNRIPKNMPPSFHSVRDKWILNRFGDLQRNNVIIYTLNWGVAKSVCPPSSKVFWLTGLTQRMTLVIPLKAQVC